MPVRIEQHVGRLEVEVQHWWLAAMQVEEAERDLSRYGEHPEQRQWRVRLAQQVIERLRAELEEDA